MTATATSVGTAQVLRTIQTEMNAELFERQTEVEAIFVAMLAAEHVFLLGVPGIAKSLVGRLTSGRITGSRYFEVLMDRQLPPESMFGPWDLKALDQGQWHRLVDGYAPTAHFFFADEIGKAGATVVNPMLTLLNERKFHNGGQVIDVPLITSIAASNEELEPELAAIRDRFLVNLVVKPIQEPGNFAQYLASDLTGTGTPTTLSLDALKLAIDVEVPAVKLPAGIIQSVMDIKAKLDAESIKPSDRRWKKSMKLLQASAYLNGRDTVDDDDLAVLRHALWDVVEQIPAVDKVVLSATGPLTRAAIELMQMLDDIEAGIDERKGQATDKRAAYGGTATSKLTEVTNRIAKLREEADRQGRSTAKLDEVKDRAMAVRVRVFHECMNAPLESAQRMATIN